MPWFRPNALFVSDGPMYHPLGFVSWRLSIASPSRFGSGRLKDQLVGRSLDDRIHLVRRIGEGAMGTVYLGRQVSVDRMVAVKVLHRSAPSFATAVGRFLTEARAASGLHHPNVVTVHDFGRTSDGLLYLVMEYLDGVTLARMLEPGPLSVARVLDLGTQICSGLGAAHARGVVHRDLKPGNILVCEVDGFGAMAKLVDFGIARVVRPGGRNDPEGLALGTPTYMSPEQASGRLAGFGSDLYSLGVILFEMLTGRPPFDDDSTAEVMQAHCFAEPPPIEPLAPWPVPAPLSRIVMQCLRKRPEDRPASASTIRAVLASLLPEVGVDVPPLPSGLELRSADTPAAPSTQVAPQRGPQTAGAVVDGRFRLDVVHRPFPDLLATATDLESPEGTQVLLRQLRLSPSLNRDMLDLVLERHVVLATRFRHDRLVGLRQVDVRSEFIQIVSTLPEGPTLESRLRGGGGLPPNDAIDIVLDLLPGIEALHELGLCHQDIRPATVRCPEDGRLLLDGVGLWPLVGTGVAMFPAEEFAEARLYKAPEQLGMLDDPVGPESDLYGIGALLYRLLTNQTPFEAHREPDVQQKKLTSNLLNPSALVPQIPAALDDVVLRLLRPRRIDRFRSVDALREALVRLRAGDVSRVGEVFRDLSAEGRLHGRTIEQRQLNEQVDRLFERRAGRFVLLVGPSGIGKTRLAEETAHLVRRRRGLVIRAKAREADVAYPFGALRELLAGMGIALLHMEPRLRDAVHRRLDAAVGNQGALLRPFAPWLARRYADAPMPPELPADVARERLLAALSQVPLALASPETPLCLLLDDLQWTNAASLAIIDRLATAVSRHPLLMLGCSRPHQGPGDLPGPFDDIAPGATLRLDMGGLSFQAVRTLLNERIGDPPGLLEMAQVFLRLTDGNPAALHALLHEAEVGNLVRWNGHDWSIDTARLNELLPSPGTVDRIQRRMAAFGVEAVEVLHACAVWGDSLHVAVLSAMCPELGRDRIVDALAAAEREGVLRPVRSDSPGLLDFAHDSLRESLLSDLDPQARRLLHRRAAEYLGEACKTGTAEGSSAERPHASPHRRAEHLLHADPRPEDVPVLEEAARTALAGGAALGAIDLAQAALACLRDRPSDDEAQIRLKLLIASTMAAARHPEDASRLLQEIVSLKPPPLLLAMAHRDLADALFLMGRLEDCVAGHMRAAEVLGYKRPATRPAFLLRKWRRALREVWWETRKVPTCAPSATPERKSAVLADILNHEARARFFAQGSAADVPLLDSLHHARRSGDCSAYARILSQTGGQLASSAGQVVLSRRMLDASVAVAEASGDDAVMALTRGTRLMIYGAMGEFERFDQERAVVEPLIARVGDSWTTGLFLSYLFDVVQERGRPGEGLQVVSAFVTQLQLVQQRDFALAWGHNRGAWVALAVGRPELARKIIEQAGQLPFVQTDRVLQGYLLAWEVQAARDGGEPERALRCAEGYLRFLNSARPAARHQAISTSVAAKACAGALLDTAPDPAGVDLLERIVDRGMRLARPFPLYHLHVQLAAVQLDLLKDRRARAARGIDRLVADAARCPPDAVVAAECEAMAGAMAGGIASPRGRTLLRRAYERLRTADDCLPFKRMLARTLGEPAGGEDEADRTASSLANLLQLPHAERFPGSHPGALQTAVPDGGIETFEWAHTSLASVARGEAPLDAVLLPIVRFAGVDQGMLMLDDRAAGRLEVLAASPAPSRALESMVEQARRVCRQAIDTSRPVIEGPPGSGNGAARGARAAFPIPRAGASDLVLFLGNRSAPFQWDDNRIRHIEALVPVLDVAASVSAGGNRE